MDRSTQPREDLDRTSQSSLECVSTFRSRNKAESPRHRTTSQHLQEWLSVLAGAESFPRRAMTSSQSAKENPSCLYPQLFVPVWKRYSSKRPACLELLGRADYLCPQSSSGFRCGFARPSLSSSMKSGPMHLRRKVGLGLNDGIVNAWGALHRPSGGRCHFQTDFILDRRDD